MQHLSSGEPGRAGQWPAVARLWNLLGPPLRPSAADLAAVRDELSAWCATNPEASPRALILGVTPELYRLPWPDPARVRAVDRTPEMIAAVWPGDPAQVICADWRELPLPNAGIDMALCDGGLHLLDYPSGQMRVLRQLARVVSPDAVVVLRLFVPPAQTESADDVLAALFGGEVPDLNCLKLRLGMALQESPETGVVLDTVWQTLSRAGGDWPLLAARLGWDLDHLAAIDAYRESSARYHFVELEAVVTMARENGFEVSAIRVPDYPMGEQCPTLTLRRSGE